MNDFENIIKKLPLDEEVIQSLKESWDESLEQAKVAAANNARKEVVEKYKSDLEKVENTVGKFIEEAVNEHVSELAQDIVKYKDARINMKKGFAKFVAEKNSEMKRFQSDMRTLTESMVNEHIEELAEDVKANRTATIKAIKESREKYDVLADKLRNKTAKVLEYIVETRVNKNLDELKSDIMEARKDRFGQELFEAFYDTFRHQFFNNNPEFQKLVEENKLVKAKSKDALGKAKTMIIESKREAAAAKREAQKIMEKAKHVEKVSEMLQPLPASTRSTIKPLLESVPYDKLETKFKQILAENDAVMRPRKVRKLSESKVTKPTARKPRKVLVETSGYEQPRGKRKSPLSDDDLSDLKRRSGIL